MNTRAQISGGCSPKAREKLAAFVGLAQRYVAAAHDELQALAALKGGARRARWKGEPNTPANLFHWFGPYSDARFRFIVRVFGESRKRLHEGFDSAGAREPMRIKCLSKVGTRCEKRRLLLANASEFGAIKVCPRLLSKSLEEGAMTMLHESLHHLMGVDDQRAKECSVGSETRCYRDGARALVQAGKFSKALRNNDNHVSFARAVHDRHTASRGPRKGGEMVRATQAHSGQHEGNDSACDKGALHESSSRCGGACGGGAKCNCGGGARCGGDAKCGCGGCRKRAAAFQRDAHGQVGALSADSSAPSDESDLDLDSHSFDGLRGEALDSDEALDDEALDDEALNDEALDDEALDDEALDDEALDDEALDDEALDDEALDDEALDDEALDDEALDDEALDDEALDDEALDDEALDDEALDDEALDDEALDDEALDDEALDDEALDDEALDDEALDDEALDDEALDDEALDDEALDDEALDFEALDEEALGQGRESFSQGLSILDRVDYKRDRTVCPGVWKFIVREDKNGKTPFAGTSREAGLCESLRIAYRWAQHAKRVFDRIWNQKRTWRKKRAWNRCAVIQQFMGTHRLFREEIRKTRLRITRLVDKFRKWYMRFIIVQETSGSGSWLCKPERHAYTTPGTGIKLCPDFFARNADQRAMIIIHEMVHQLGWSHQRLPGVGGAWVKSQIDQRTDAITLAQVRPWRARRSPVNFGWMLMELRACSP